MVPLASSAHGGIGYELAVLFAGQAKDRGIRCFVEPGVFDPEVADMKSYRVPDLGYARPADVTERGIEGRAALAIEILSPRDESYEKLPFYLQVGVEELLYLDQSTRAFEVRRPEGAGWVLVGADDDGWTPLASLGVALRLAGGRLLVRTDAGTEEA